MSEASAEIVLGSSLDIDVLVYNLGFLKHLQTSFPALR